MTRPLARSRTIAALALLASAVPSGRAPAAPAAETAPAARLTLEDAVSAALSRNERIGARAADAETAAQRALVARSFFFPDVTVSAAYTRRLNETIRTISDRSVAIQRHDALSAQATVTQPLFYGGALPLYRQAKLEREAAALSADDERRLVGYEAAHAFLMVLSLEQVRGAAERRVELGRASVDDTRARAGAGLSSSNDVTRAELDLATAERELVRAGTDLTMARAELGALLNLEIEGALAPPERLLAAALAPPATEADLVVLARDRRLDLKAGERRARALEQAAREPARRALPRVDFVAQYRVTNEAGLSGRTGDGYAGLVATWSLWDGGERGAERAAREAAARAGALEQDARTRLVARDVRRARTALLDAQAGQRLAAVAAEVGRRNVRETVELYRQGLVRAFEMLDANARLFDAEVALAREYYGLGLALLDLGASLGEPPPGEKTRP